MAKRKEWAAAVLGRRNKDKAAFCRSLDWDVEIKWFDKVGMHRLDDVRTAKIELATRGTSDQYEGFRVTVLNKHEGKVDSKYFAFDDYLSPKLEDREDARDEYPGGHGSRCFQVKGHCGFDWYIARPLEVRPFCEAVEGYLEMFR